MAKASKKPADRKSKAPKPAAPFVASTIEHTEWGADALNRVELFTITDDGNAVVYDMPAAMHPGRLLAFLSMARKQGEEMAAAWLLEVTIGEEGFAALCAEPELTSDTIRGISRRITQVIAGRAPDVDYSKVGDDETEADADPT